MEIGGDTIHATPTEYDDRTTADGKTSSVHWLRFKLTPEQIARFRQQRAGGAGRRAHNYGHMAVLSDETTRGAGEGFRLTLGISRDADRLELHAVLDDVGIARRRQPFISARWRDRAR